MKPTCQLVLVVSLCLGASGCGDRSPEVASTPTTPLPVPLEEQRAEIARDMLELILREPSSDPQGDLRILKVELSTLIDRLYILRQRGLSPAEPSYNSTLFATADLEMLDELERRVQANPQLGFEIENLLRGYNLMDCETLDAAMRSWLVVQTP